MNTKFYIAMLIITLALFSFSTVYAQSNKGTTWGYGVNLGAARGDNSGSGEEWVPAGRGYFQMGFSKNFLAQFGLSYLPLKATDDNLSDLIYKAYELQLITADVRFLFSPVQLGLVSPYIYAGVGAGKDIKSSQSDFVPVFPAGFGIQAKLGRTVSFDVHGGYTLASDKLDDRTRLDGDWNRFVASRYDGFYTVMAGISLNSPFGRKDEPVVLLDNTIDTDSDGLTDEMELSEYKTDPRNSDTDGDGLADGFEVKSYKTDPNKTDTDGDGLNDYAEVMVHKTNPLKIDTDMGGVNDGAEVQAKLNPLNPNDDKNLNSNETIIINEAQPNVDSDRDGLSDVDETNKYRTDPNKMDTDMDGLSDGEEVLTYRTDPLKPDTDGDQLTDGKEVTMYKTDPLKTDSDNDGLGDYEEINTYRTNPVNIDTDGGGMNDGAEIKAKKNPLDPSDDLYSFTPDKTLILDGVNFATAQATILPVSAKTLTRVYESLEANPDVKILITGHTDSQGGDSYNQDLSMRRAASVKTWLVNKGISSSRISVEGRGENEPIASNETTDGRAQNRRIEIDVAN